MKELKPIYLVVPVAITVAVVLLIVLTGVLDGPLEPPQFVTLRKGDEWLLWVCVSPAFCVALDDAERKMDHKAVFAIHDADKVFVVEAGTRAKLVEHTPEVSLVSFIDGEFKGRSGYVMSKHVHPPEP